MLNDYNWDVTNNTMNIAYHHVEKKLNFILIFIANSWFSHIGSPICRSVCKNTLIIIVRRGKWYIL